jgi:hypothetical protein
MKMADEDCPNRVRIDFELADRDHGGCAAVHKKGTGAILYVKAGVEASAATKSIA